MDWAFDPPCVSTGKVVPFFSTQVELISLFALLSPAVTVLGLINDQPGHPEVAVCLC